jgi:hypothetical protein
MSRRKAGAKRRRLKQALGVAGASLLLATGASASAAMPVPQTASQLLHDEEVSDVTLATFYYFDRENDLPSRGAGAGGSAGPGAGARSCGCQKCGTCKTCRSCYACSQACRAS